MDLPDSGIKSGSPALQADSLPAEPSGKPLIRKGQDPIHILRRIDTSLWRQIAGDKGCAQEGTVDVVGAVGGGGLALEALLKPDTSMWTWGAFWR